MIRTSLMAYFRTGQLGPFVASCPRISVLKSLGQPPYWEGHTTLPYEESDIWIYGSIQFNFDQQMQLADTHIGFDSTFNGISVNYADWTSTFIQFDDLDFDKICTPQRFQKTMAANRIAATPYSLSGGHVMINTAAGVQARFSTKTDFKASINCERRIATDEPYLHRVTTVVLAEPGGEPEPPITRDLKP